MKHIIRNETLCGIKDSVYTRMYSLDDRPFDFCHRCLAEVGREMMDQYLRVDIWESLKKYQEMKPVKEWWENLSMIQKTNIIDYKFTDFDWDCLNDIDKGLIKMRYDSSKQTKKYLDTSSRCSLIDDQPCEPEWTCETCNIAQNVGE